MGYLIDTHCHLDVKHTPEQLAGVISRAKEAGVGKMIWVGIDGKGTERALDAASRSDALYVSAGVHPHDSVKYTSNAGERFRELACSPKVVAIGETGLDFYRDYSPRDTQLSAFVAQCEIACETGLPIVIHSRDAAQETWEVVDGFLSRGLRGVFHCFAYDIEYARRATTAGFYIALNGMVTYPKSIELREMAAKLPLERIVIETDAPFLLPQKYRHRDNEPAFLVETFEKLTEIFKADPLELKEQLRINSEGCFPKLAAGI